MSKFPSVSAVLDVLRKPALEWWYKINTAEFCDAESNKGKEIGSLVHKIIQQHIEDEEIEIETKYPDEVKNAVKSFFKFKRDFPKIKLQKAEISLVVEEYGYTMKLDCIGKENDDLILIDWKIGKCNIGTKKETDTPRIFPEHIYQASTYVVGYNTVYKTNIKKAYIVSPAKDKITYGLLIITENSIKSNFEEVFLPALKIYNYQKSQEVDDGYKNSSGRTGQGNSSDTKRGGGYSSKSNELPSGF